MNYKCHACIFKAGYKFEDKYLTICIRNPSRTVKQAVEECYRPEICPHHTTHKEAKILFGDKLNDN